MIDLTPSPYGDVTRRWTHLATAQRLQHATRLLGPEADDVALVGCESALATTAYAQLVDAARDGDQIAFAWLATVHRPLMLQRGRVIFEDDPAEWGALCLELLARRLRLAALESGPWLRRHIAMRLVDELSRRTHQHLRRRRTERATDPVVLPTIRNTWSDPRRDPGHDPHPELSDALAEALTDLDPATVDALRASADGAPLYEVAARHDIDAAVLRQRLWRARRRLQPDLAAFQRSSS